MYLGVAITAFGTADAKASQVVRAQRWSHVMVAAALSTKATKSPCVHFAALASELMLLPGIHDIALYVQKKAGRFSAALVLIKTANIHASGIVLVQMLAEFPSRLADALKVKSANFALSMALKVLAHYTRNIKMLVESRSDLVVPVLVQVPSLTCVPRLHFASYLNDEKNVRTA